MTSVFKVLIALSFIIPLFQNTPSGQSPSAVVFKTASRHPMQYYLSLPEDWTPNREWPILVVIEGGRKDFKNSAVVYAQARKSMHFIIVSPVILTNGGRENELRTLAEYNYPSSVWDEVDRTGRCEFDLKGLDAVIADVRQQYKGQERYFIAGHSAGAHLTWMMVLMSPEKLLAATTSGGGYEGRCITKISNAPERVNLPVRSFLGEKDVHRAGFEDQFKKVKRLANSHGYKNISYEMVKGKEHVILADEALGYFSALVKESGSSK